ncbi:MAG: M28 family peptidase, partial [Alphaproteobacteria bacterium]
NRPVLFLLTDGEETALLGAQAFVDSKEKYGVEVGRIINLEARGVRGPAMMFETGHPNAGIVGDWSKSGARPVANSMMTAVYELLPNSTDLTVHLQSGSTGINIAIADGLDFYHTNHDDLARLDRDSVQHMGDQALGATRTFLAGDWSGDKTGGEIVYSDIGTRLFLALPEMFALLLLGLCFGVSAMLLVRPSRDSGWMKLDWRALALPPALIAVAGGLAFLTQQAIGLIRPEPSFWTAHPQALNMTFFAGTALVAAAAVAFLAPNSRRETLFASGWFWFLIVGMGLSFAVPGFSMLYLIPGIVFVLTAAVAWLFPRHQMPAYIIASVVLALIFFPILHMLDVMMGLGMAAAFGVVEATVLAPMLAIIGGLRNGKALVFSVLGAAFAIGVVTTAVVPAYSPDRPLALNFSAQYDMDERRAALYAGARPGSLPKAIRDQLTVGEIPPPVGATNVLAARKLDFAARPHAIATLVNDTASGDGKRVIRLQLGAPGARMVRVRIPAGAYPTQLNYDGRTIAMREPQQGYYVVEIVGRASDGATLEFTLQPPASAPAAKPDWLVQGIWTELPPEGRALADARPDTAVRIQMGDTTITTKRQQF